MRPVHKYDLVIDDVVNKFYEWVEKRFEANDVALVSSPRRPAKPPIANKKQIKEQKTRSSEAKTEASRIKNMALGKLANEGLRWKQDQLDTLREKFLMGLTLTEIGELLERKPTAVGSKLKGLELLEAFSIPKEYVIMKIEDDFATIDQEIETSVPEYTYKEWTPEEAEELAADYKYGLNASELMQKYERTALGLMIKLESVGAFQGKSKHQFGHLVLEYRGAYKGEGIEATA